jgi:hypothetical protein
MDFELTQHAKETIEERKIPVSYVERVIKNPELIHPDLNDTDLEHRLGAIEEYEGRVLRVIINKNSKPIKLVTAYFDRKMRGKL